MIKSIRVDNIEYDRGWVSPDGEVYPVGWGEHHTDIANDIMLNKYGIGRCNSEYELEQRGWIKWNYNNILVSDKMTELQFEKLYELFENSVGFLSDPNAVLRVNFQPMTLKQFVDEFGKSENIDFHKGYSNNDRGWIDPYGEFYPADYKMTQRDMEKWDDSHSGSPVFHWRIAENIMQYEPLR